MVVLSASILLKNGVEIRNDSILLSRQFIPLNRSRVISLLQSFPKLVSSSQHNYVETDQVRYVFQSLDHFYVVLITNKHSDTIEDLLTLRLLIQILKEKCPHLTPEEISANAFELLFAFDETVSLGLREPLTTQQVNVFLAMDSEEEKMQKIITDSKILETKRLAKERAEELDLKKRMLREQERERERQRQLQARYGYGFEDDEGDDIPTSYAQSLAFDRQTASLTPFTAVSQNLSATTTTNTSLPSYHVPTPAVVVSEMPKKTVKAMSLRRS